MPAHCWVFAQSCLPFSWTAWELEGVFRVEHSRMFLLALNAFWSPKCCMYIILSPWLVGPNLCCSRILCRLRPQFLFTKSLCHRMGQAGRDHSGSSDPTSLLRQSHPRAHGAGLCPDSSWISPAKENLQPLWAICCIFVLSALSLWKWKHSMWSGSCGGKAITSLFSNLVNWDKHNFHTTRLATHVTLGIYLLALTISNTYTFHWSFTLYLNSLFLFHWNVYIYIYIRKRK